MPRATSVWSSRWTVLFVRPRRALISVMPSEGDSRENVHRTARARSTAPEVLAAASGRAPERWRAREGALPAVGDTSISLYSVAGYTRQADDSGCSVAWNTVP